MLPIRVPTGFRIIAHRGASGYAPENTHAAFELAGRMGVTEVELDLRLSKDKQLIVCHDESLDRYGHTGLRVAQLTYEELLKLDMGSWFSPFQYADERVLTLEQLFSQFGGRFFYHLEVKANGEETVRLIVRSLDAFNLRHRALMTCFDGGVLDIAGAIAPDIPRGWLVREGGFSEENIQRAATLGYFQICPRAEDIERERVLMAKRRKLEVRAHGVQGMADIERVIEAGADGLTIDWPDWLRHADDEIGDAA